MVRVAGLSKAMRIDFEEVLVKADDAYHDRQSIWGKGGVSQARLMDEEGRRARLNIRRALGRRVPAGRRQSRGHSGSCCHFWRVWCERHRSGSSGGRVRGRSSTARRGCGHSLSWRRAASDPRVWRRRWAEDMRRAMTFRGSDCVRRHWPCMARRRDRGTSPWLTSSAPSAGR